MGLILSRSILFTARVPLPRLAHIARYESTKPTPKLKEALEAQDNLRRDWDAKILSYEELKPKTLQPSPETYLVDVREPDEVLQGSIPSSVNLPLSTLPGSLHLDAAAFKEKYGFQKPHRDQEIVFYCRSGKRAATACDIAKRNGYTNLANYQGSWLDWVAREGIKTA
ncbi:Rhodanese-like protein [Laetiporus sulphureus 93-53]|uniref:Rhodanese-like protein n=1 Tax=Laetiporus sulphureus 93-53 TaxID=1314785 RepID=A0A165ECV5_9APHY|nr:Rhodanese-like protein [Laetiporus sulphureus 93-53]KZT06752.1 Rhodanese-like protein [Laetiporus sulphureus 93-53]